MALPSSCTNGNSWYSTHFLGGKTIKLTYRIPFSSYELNSDATFDCLFVFKETLS